MKLKLSIILLLCSCFVNAQNFSNTGKEFWVGYGHNQLFNITGTPNAQTMVLYLSAGNQAANVTVSVNGTTWSRSYSIAPHSVAVSDPMPKTGTDDCRILSEGAFNKAIHISSDVPIVAYAHTYGVYSSGGTMLLPVESYSYTYFSVNPEQQSADSYSWFYVVASEDNTQVRITPSRPTSGGKQQNVPFTVTLSKGQLYNVMGQINGNSSYEMSGSKIQSLPGADGKCHPVGVFSGSSRTFICVGDLFGSGSDYVMQQVFPLNAWGTKYITSLTSRSSSPSTLNNNKFRVYIREPNTLVRKNGVLLTGLNNNFYYDYVASTSDVITATKPILVAQFIPSATGCGTQGLGDPEMFCLSPVEQSINDITFYNTDKEAISVNYLTLIIPTNGLSSLKIDGSNVFDYTYAHPNAPGYTVVVKQLQLAPMQHTAKSDSSFTAITYGLGQYETYGYNAGTLLRNLESVMQVKNVYGSGTTDYTCPNTPFHAVFKTIYKPASILWQLSAVSGLSPNTDVLLNNYPTPTDSVVENQRKFYLYELPGNYVFTNTGSYNIPVTVTDLLIENCSFSEKLNIPIKVIAGPTADFTAVSSCAKDSIHITATSPEALLIKRWNWDFNDGSIDSVQNPVKAYNTSGNYTIALQAIRNDGCLSSVVNKPVEIYPLPVVDFKLPDIICMPNGIASFTNLSSLAGNNNPSLAYEWSFGDNTTSTDNNPTHYYATAGSYTVKLKAMTDKVCKDSLSKTLVSFVSKPTADFSVLSPTTCENQSIDFADQSTPVGSIASWIWNFGNSQSSQLQNPSVQYNAANNYDVQLIVKATTGCTDTTKQSIKIYPQPVVEAGPDRTIIQGTSIQLNGAVTNGLPTNIAWLPITNLSDPSSLSTIASPPVGQLYYLNIVGDGGCKAYDSILIKVLKKIQVPNAFSPNGDGINDYWLIPSLDEYANTAVEIFNRNGQLIFHSKGYNNPWDGKYNGKPLPVGTYYYIINIPSQQALRGNVVLLK